MGGGFTRIQVSLALHCQSGISLSIQDQEHTDIVPLPPLRGQTGGAAVKCAAFSVAHIVKLFRIDPILNANVCSQTERDGPKANKCFFFFFN